MTEVMYLESQKKSQKKKSKRNRFDFFKYN